ncbi:nitroreductase family deazaflavin-dependent oxidoreductase [soil metagenome]
MSEEARLPGWLKLANPAIVALQRRGVVIGVVRLLCVPGRKSGKLHTTPVSPLTVDGERYIIAGLEDADWVKNARIAGWGILERGREQERVNLVELPIQERAPVLREFPREVPHGVRYFRQLYGISGTPEEFGSLAPRCPVFRVEEAGP